MIVTESWLSWEFSSTVTLGQTRKNSRRLLSRFKFDESAWESMRAHESVRPNESESLNSQQLSSSFGPGFFLVLNKSGWKRGHIQVVTQMPRLHATTLQSVFIWRHGGHIPKQWNFSPLGNEFFSYTKIVLSFRNTNIWPAWKHSINRNIVCFFGKAISLANFVRVNY